MGAKLDPRRALRGSSTQPAVSIRRSRLVSARTEASLSLGQPELGMCSAVPVLQNHRIVLGKRYSSPRRLGHSAGTSAAVSKQRQRGRHGWMPFRDMVLVNRRAQVRVPTAEAENQTSAESLSMKSTGRVEAGTAVLPWNQKSWRVLGVALLATLSGNVKRQAGSAPSLGLSRIASAGAVGMQLMSSVPTLPGHQQRRLSLDASIHGGR